MKYLFIAEKPSLMKEVQSCYRNHAAEVRKRVGEIDFVALSGHVCTNFEPNDYEEWKTKRWADVEYPIIPSEWKIKIISDEYKRKTVRNIRNIADDYDGFIVGTDSDVEGYGIYYLLENYIGIQKRKALRFIEHSLTDQEIYKSLLSMTDFHTDPVHIRYTQSFLLRSHADWLYGMNATRMMTNKLESLMTIGRVKAPTIKLVYDNSKSIDDFKQRTYFNIKADYFEDLSSLMIDEKGRTIQFDSIEQTRLNVPKDGIIVKKEKQEVLTNAPKLYDLTSIQSEAGQMYGYDPTQTLEIVQSLYEKHKVISYPRTQCRYVSSEKSKEFPSMLEKMHVFPELSNYAVQITRENIKMVYKDKNVVNDKEVEKESHDALLPTSNRPVLSNMTAEEKNICKMIYKRLLAQFLPKLKENKTNLVVKHGDYLFAARGKVIADHGWRVLYKKSKDFKIPDLSEGTPITAKSIKPVQKKTMPPKRLTQATLISAMKNIANLIEDKELKASLADSQGIGTPATRANIIKDIIEKGFVNDDNGLYITELGKSYVENMSGIDIISPTFAAILDTEIKKIQRGEANYDIVYKKVLDDLEKMCGQIEALEGSGVKQVDHECIKCGSKLIDTRYYYKCCNNGCDFKIPKLLCGLTVDESLLDILYAGKPTGIYDFKKKDGSKFKGRLKLTYDGLKFDFSSGLRCPLCGKSVIVNKAGYFCDCGVKVFNPCYGKTLSGSEVATLLSRRSLPISDGFISKNGKEYSAGLVLNENGRVELNFGT